MQIPCSTQSAYHVQHVVCHVVRRDSSAIKFDGVEIVSILALFYQLNHKPIKERRKPEHPEETSNDELQKMPHTKIRKFKPLARLEPAL